jgi:hypothetical protein
LRRSIPLSWPLSILRHDSPEGDPPLAGSRAWLSLSCLCCRPRRCRVHSGRQKQETVRGSQRDQLIQVHNVSTLSWTISCYSSIAGGSLPRSHRFRSIEIRILGAASRPLTRRRHSPTHQDRFWRVMAVLLLPFMLPTPFSSPSSRGPSRSRLHDDFPPDLRGPLPLLVYFLLSSRSYDRSSGVG